MVKNLSQHGSHWSLPGLLSIRHDRRTSQKLQKLTTSTFIHCVISTNLKILHQKHLGLAYTPSHSEKHSTQKQQTVQISQRWGTLLYRLFIFLFSHNFVDGRFLATVLLSLVISCTFGWSVTVLFILASRLYKLLVWAISGSTQHSHYSTLSWKQKVSCLHQAQPRLFVFRIFLPFTGWILLKPSNYQCKFWIK